MKKSIFITGIAGSGKTSVSIELNKRGYTAYDIENTGDLFSMRDKITDEIITRNINDDVEAMKQSKWICDPKKMKVFIDLQPDGITFYCGGASNNDELLPLFDKTIVLVADEEVVYDRLSTRGPGEFGNTHEMREWELSFKDWFEDHLQELGAIKTDANQPVEKVADEAIHIALSA